MPLAPAFTSLLSGSCGDCAKAHLAKQEKTAVGLAKPANLLLFRHNDRLRLIFII
jgi:hypothetical protein